MIRINPLAKPLSRIGGVRWCWGIISAVGTNTVTVKVKTEMCNIRGGTDGSRFSFMGLPCPNIFAGELAFHSKEEWVSVQDMEKAAETIVHLSAIWEEKA